MIIGVFSLMNVSINTYRIYVSINTSIIKNISMFFSVLILGPWLRFSDVADVADEVIAFNAALGAMAGPWLDVINGKP